MERGMDFLKSQMSNAVMLHRTFLQSLEDHESQADDPRFRDLCTRFVAKARLHQRLLEDYQHRLGANDGVAAKAIGIALGVGRDLADVAGNSDFLRLVGDIVMARQAEDTFKTFREAGRTLALHELAKIGEMGERDQDEYVKDANRLAQQIFIEHVRGTEAEIRVLEQPSTSL